MNTFKTTIEARAVYDYLKSAAEAANITSTQFGTMLAEASKLAMCAFAPAEHGLFFELFNIHIENES